MCITHPVKVIKVGEGSAIVDYKNCDFEVKTSLLPGLKQDDWVLIHANLALKKISQEEAEEIKKLYKEFI